MLTRSSKAHNPQPSILTNKPWNLKRVFTEEQQQGLGLLARLGIDDNNDGNNGDEVYAEATTVLTKP